MVFQRLMSLVGRPFLLLSFILCLLNVSIHATSIAQGGWEKSTSAASYTKGQCGVHITHYQIPRGDNKYYLEAQIKDAAHLEIGHVDKTDATEPVNISGALPLVLVITAAKPGSSEDPDGAPLQFTYRADSWVRAVDSTAQDIIEALRRREKDFIS
ncbi:MAG: hypothetical protein Q9226_003109 [Calogaya cf. arnoldii]